jgi:hypothetical protein
MLLLKTLADIALFTLLLCLYFAYFFHPVISTSFFLSFSSYFFILFYLFTYFYLSFLLLTPIENSTGNLTF